MGQKKPAASAREENLDLYESLFALDHNFSEILVSVERLRNQGLFRDRFQRQSIAICQAALKETRAWFNFEILQILLNREEGDLAHFDRIRHEQEKALAGSDQPAAPQKGGTRGRRVMSHI